MDTNLLLLAIEDFLPVIFSGVGLWVLAGLSRHLDRRAGNHVTAGFLLITLGGLSKPVYKTLLAVSGGDLDITVLDDVLFWLLAPGFLVLTAGLRRVAHVDRGRTPAATWWGVATAVVTIALATVLAFIASEAWFYVLLAVATLGNVLAIITLVSWARVRRDGVAAGLYIGNVVLVFGLAGAAAALEQTIAAQWGEQLVSTAAQALFMWASFRLAAATSR